VSQKIYELNRKKVVRQTVETKIAKAASSLTMPERDLIKEEIDSETIIDISSENISSKEYQGITQDTTQ